jgi:hypothetical protein
MTTIKQRIAERLDPHAAKTAELTAGLAESTQQARILQDSLATFWEMLENQTITVKSPQAVVTGMKEAGFDQALLSQMLDQLGWDTISSLSSDGEAQSQQRQNAVDQAVRLFRYSPLAQWSIWLWTGWGLGDKITVTLKKPAAQDVWNEFVTAERNEPVLSVDVIHKLSDWLLVKGNRHLAFFTTTEGSSAGLVAKVERAEAVESENLRTIMESSDVVMVARGDLGVEVGDAAVPPIQKRMLRMAPKYNCPVIVATQMMESMCDNPIPTRAEVNDVANAVLDGTDAVMLSGESAAGKYPIEAVEAMHRTCMETEKQKVLPSASTRDPRFPPISVDECVARQAIETAHMMPIKAIVAFTQSGNTTLYMSRHLGDVPIYALTPEISTLGRVSLFRNVTPKMTEGSYDSDTDAPRATREVIGMLKRDGLVKPGDMIVMTLGTPMGQAGATNTMKIVEIED